MGADGSSQIRLTDHPSDDYNPVWSPDGAWIAFDSDRDPVEGDEIYLLSPDGTGLTRAVPEGVFPTWSPDGERLLYSSKEGLFSARADGTGATRLLERAVYAAFSPDGSTVAAAVTDYDEECNARHSLILTAADGSDRRQLLP